MAGLFTGGPSTPVSAQHPPDEAQLRLGAQLWTERFPCRNCHGGMANGVGDVPQEQGPSLRVSTLTPEEVAEVIRCGRPGTGMPHFDGRAYTDGRCYGLTAADIGDDMPPRGTPNVTQRSLDALVAFIFANFVGKPDPTGAECVAIWGETAPLCERFP